MKIKIESEEELLQVASEAIHVLTNLRYWTMEWEREHGSELRSYKKHFEKRADQLLCRLGAFYENRFGKIELVIQNNSNDNVTTSPEGDIREEQ